MNLSYACERFYTAMLSLICEGKLTDRLTAAFESLSTLTHNDFSDDNKLRERFSNLLRNLAKFDSERPLSIAEIEAESKRVDLEQTEKVAQEVLSIFTDLAYRDPTYYYHVPSDIDLRSQFAVIPEPTPEKPDPSYDWSKLSVDELRQLRSLVNKARRE